VVGFVVLLGALLLTGGGLATTSTAGNCSKDAAKQAVARYQLGDPEVADPVIGVLCGSFTGPGSETMVVSLAGPGSTGMIDWVVFRWSGDAWELLLKRHQAATLTAVGSDILETIQIYRPGDPRCCPTGGTKSRLWHWNGTQLVAGAWKLQISHSEFFSPLKPRRNLWCGMEDSSRFRGVACKTVRPARKVTMDANGGLKICRGFSRCVGCTCDEGHDPTLGFRKQVTVGRFRCVSLRTGVRCTVIPSGRGFLFNSAGVTKVGSSHSAMSTASVLAGDVRTISAGDRFTCALTNEGGVKCWGFTSFAGSPSPVPVDVPGLERGVKALSVGTGHACVVTTKGAAKCWGSNVSGELGNGTQRSSAIPVAVRGLSRGVTAIAAGDVHTCAIVAHGALECWGQQVDGELGNGSSSRKDALAPVAVTGLSRGVKAVAVANRSTCALTASGGVKCWGVATLGNGSTTKTSSSTPVDVVGLSNGAKGITVGYLHACAITSAGGVKCWGHNLDGELGDGTFAPSAVPVDVRGLSSGVSAISAGDTYEEDHTCALTTGGGVKCWGENLAGELGHGFGTGLYSLIPVDVVGLSSGVKAIDAGEAYACAATIEGFAKCWGDNLEYQLGNTTRLKFSEVPVDVIPWQVITLRASKAAGVIARGTAVTFTATVSPPLPGGRPATVRFEVYHRVGSTWQPATTRDVSASATGTATLLWTFSTPGSWFVRARALAAGGYAASSWSANVRYAVSKSPQAP
jgi:alpha-tubulin suppressor-like RCC1 family protein